MATQIRPNRLEVSDRFPMLGFTVRTDGTAKRYEIAIGTSPDLFGPDGKSHRSRSNFYSTRAAGPLPIERGESVYVLPPDVLARFVGQEKLYYGLATGSNGNGKVEVITVPGSGSPYINLSGLTGRSLQRVRLLPSRQRLASTYGKSGSEMEWAGDLLTPGTQPATPAPPKNGDSKDASSTAPVHYDDGYGPLPPTPTTTADPNPQPQPQATSFADDGSSADEDAQHGIDGPIPDDGATTQGLSRPLALSPEFPQASRFESAYSGNYRAVSGTRTINRIVIHITDGQPKLNGTVSWFKNPSAGVSAHYVVGQDGEVVQMVKHNDIAWHASSANGDSIGIEHVARSPHEWDRKLGHTDPGMMPTDAQYCGSAALVNWLCTQFNLPMDRDHVLGHSEADPKTTHTDCPNAVWDWDYYMGLVTSGTCSPRATASSLSSRATPWSAQRSRASALADQSFNENWNDVEVFGQPDGFSCWATAAAMVVGWRDKLSLDIATLKRMFKDQTGASCDAGLYPNDDQKLADFLGLVAEPPQSYSVEGFRRILENYGPLWAGIRTNDGWNHAVVITGLYGDGTPDNTFVRIHDPWGRPTASPTQPGGHNPSPGVGSRYTLTYSEFAKEYEDRITASSGAVNVQILHAADTGGRTISAGADQTYALAASASPNSQQGRHRNQHDKKTKTATWEGARAQTYVSRAVALVDDSEPQPAQLPPAKRLTGWEKQVVRGAIEALLSAGAPPVSTVLPLLIHMVNDQGLSVGIGLGGDVGILAGGGLGFGVILAPNNDVGVFGGIEISDGPNLLAGLAAGARIVVVRGGIDSFNEKGYALGLTVEAEGPSVSVIALLNEQKEFRGVSFQLGAGIALSPIQIFVAAEKSVSTAVTQSLGANDNDEDSQHGIDGPIPDDTAAAQSLARSLALAPESPQASRFVQADSANYRAVSGIRTINRIVIHITDGGSKINGTISWFRNPAAKVSAHYVIGQDGEVVQMVKHNDVSWHASSANGDSIGIEHVANTRGLNPTPAQYCASAALVNWLASQFSLPIDRTHILGHSEADPRTTHTGCPNAVWDWDYYMGMVTSSNCDVPQPQSQSLSVRLPAPPRRLPRGRAMEAEPRLIANSPVTTTTGGEGNITWELDQFTGMKMAPQSVVASMQSAETIHLSNWPYCDHANGSRASAWFTVDWKFSGQALGQVRITPCGTQQGPYPLRVEARVEDGTGRGGNTLALLVRFTYHFSTADGPEVVALTDLVLYSDGSIDQRSNWTSQVAA
jgi:N-acetyl-anhydromuramyl-L-alanine amidase AmpD